MGMGTALPVWKRGWPRFAAAAVGAVVTSAAFVAMLQFQPVSSSLITAIDDIGEGVAAFLAAAACAWAARRGEGRVRKAWALMAVSAASWGVGEMVWSVYEVGLNVSVPYPSPADAGFLVAVPFAFAAVVFFWRPRTGQGFSWSRLVVDGLIVFLSLTFTAWALGLRLVFADTGDSFLERFLDLAYPLGDLLVGTVLILGVRRATHQQQGRMLLLLGGLAANALADSAFAYLQANGDYTVRGSVLDAGWVVGYLMIGLSALWPAAPRALVRERSPYDLWQLVLPWVSVVSAGVSAFVLALNGQQLDLFLTALVGVGATLLTISMIMAQRDSLGALAASQRSEATLAEVFAHAPAGVVRISADLRIIDANIRFGELLGTNGQDQAGIPIARYFAASDGEQFLDKIKALSAGESDSVESDCEAKRGDGTTVWLHWSAAAVRTDDAAKDYFILMLEDTTARHEAEAAATASLEVLERLNGLKSEFLQSVSHEFKTALIGIQGFSEFMRDSDQLDLSDVRTFASDIYRDADRLDRMVTEMLDLDRVESSRTTMRVVDVDMNALIVREVEQKRATSSSVEIAVDLASDAVPAAGDPDKLALVVRTLLDHAVKYSPEHGRVTISSRISGSSVEVIVADEGSGVRADFDNRLFGQSDLYANNPIRKVVGTGLGLGIARQVVEMHGGRIWVDRHEPSAGSEFHFTIPAAAGVKVA